MSDVLEVTRLRQVVRYRAETSRTDCVRAISVSMSAIWSRMPMVASGSARAMEELGLLHVGNAVYVCAYHPLACFYTTPVHHRTKKSSEVESILPGTDD
jgi:hypothetical protein